MRRRFRYALDPLCLVASACYLASRFVLKPHAESLFVRGQLSDLLLIPCALPMVLWIQRQLRLRAHDNTPNASEIILHLVVWSFAAEWLAPLFFPVTADPRDVVAYAAGAALAWGCWNFPTRSEFANEAS